MIKLVYTGQLGQSGDASSNKLDDHLRYHIERNILEYYFPENLTIGGIYYGENHEDYHEYYFLINDKGLKSSYSKSLFKTLDEIRNEKIDILLN